RRGGTTRHPPPPASNHADGLPLAAGVVTVTSRAIDRGAARLRRVPCPTLAWACSSDRRHAHASVGHGTRERLGARRRKIALFAAALAVCGLFSRAARADEKLFAAPSGSWSLDANWTDLLGNPSTVPVNGDSVGFYPVGA